MIKNIKLEFIVFLLSLMIVINYVTMFAFYNNYLGKIVIPFYFIILLLFIFKDPKDYIVFKISIIIIGVISLGTPTTEWDAWAIWLFHAKRIFFEENFFATLDSYTFLHNDYPLIAPAFSVSLVQFIGGWNEIFPKFSFFLIFIPPLLFSLKIFNEKFNFIFLIMTIFILNEFILNGYLDGLISIYFTFSLYFIYKIFIGEKDNFINFLTLFCFLIILSLLKNEGFVLTLIILSFIFVNNILIKKKYNFFIKKNIIFLSILPYLAWRFICIKNGLTTDVISDADFSRFANFNYFYETFIIISNYLIFNLQFVVCLVIFILSFYLNKNKKILFLVLYCSFTYLIILFLIYFTTPHDLVWHLKTSSLRTMLVIKYVFCFFALINFSNKELKF